MTRTIITMTLLLVILLPLSGAGLREYESRQDELVVYAYDSFASDWGPGPIAVESFTRETGIPVTMISAGDAGQVLQRTILERDRPRADVVIGIDNNSLARAIDADILEPYRSPELDAVPRSLHLDSEYRLLPFDHGFFSIIYDSSVISDPPATLEDLTREEYENQLILMDPRTSSPGLGFLFWTIAVYGDEYLDYWERLKPSILTITDGWGSGYGAFTQGEAPLVLSYTTSPPYHVEYEDTTRFQAAIFHEGHYAQIEGIGIVKGTERQEEARQFVDFILGRSFQEVIPQTNWMYPAREDARLPDSFDYAPIPETSLLLDTYEIEEHGSRWIDQWVEVMSY